MTQSATLAQDFSSIPVIDSHLHPVSRMLISQAYAGQKQAFAEYLTPPGDYDGRDALLQRKLDESQKTVWDAPRRIGYFNYVARTYGVEPTLEGFDSVTSRHIGSDADFTAYVTSIFDRENIQHVMLQAREEMPTPPATLIPADRYLWTSVVFDLSYPEWAIGRGLTEVEDVATEIEDLMERAVANGVRGFKDASAYLRPLGLTRPTAAEAQSAFVRLRSAAAADRDPADMRAYQDFLMRRAYAKAGRLERPIIIHVAVALHPALRIDFNDPRPLYHVFMDPEILRAETRFILIHGGYPMQDVIACYISQFPNVFTDVSFYAKYPGALARMYSELLTIGPASKIMHGSDTNSVPEEIGYCAGNSRQALAAVLSEYRRSYGWTSRDVNDTAEKILYRNSLAMFGEVSA